MKGLARSLSATGGPKGGSDFREFPLLKTIRFRDPAGDGPQVRGADGRVEGRAVACQDVEVGLLPSG
jgi:hypothetical protein